MITVKEHSLTIRTIGGGYGETLLLSIGQSYRFGIDSNKYLNYSINDRESILSQFLQGNQMDYWVISHYHLDHFQGFGRIVQNNLVKRMLIPDDYLIEDFRSLILKDTVQNTESNLAGSEAINEYDLIKKLVLQSGYKVMSLSSGTASIIKETVVDVNGVECELEISVYAMTKKETNSLRRKSIISLSKDNETQKSRGSVINSTSLIVCMKYGKFNGLYLADAPLSRINNFLNLNETKSYNFLKIGHHGSNTSSNKTLISRIKKNKMQYAVVTPFNKSKLPDPKVLELYLKEGYIVQITSLSCLNNEIVANLKRNWDYPNELEGSNIEIHEAFNLGQCIVDVHFNYEDITK